MILRQGIFVNHLLLILFLSQLKEDFIEMGVSPLPKRKSITGAMLFLRRTENALACKIPSFLNLYFIHSFVGSAECHVDQVLSEQRFVDFVICRSKVYVFPSVDVHLPVHRSSSIRRSMLSYSSTAAVR